MQTILTTGAVMLTIAAAVASGVPSSSNQQEKEQAMTEASKPIPVQPVNDLTIKVVYDNNPHKEGLETAWGFSAFITGAEKNILFDTGGDGPLLLRNMQRLQVDPKTIDAVVLSHVHADHTGGLGGFLDKNPNVTVYVLKSFPARIADEARKRGAKVVEVKEPLQVCGNVYSTGQLGRLIKEQSLIIRTKAGLVIISGCAHPGIAGIVNTAKSQIDGDILLVMGGFHLEWATKGKIEKIIAAFKQMGVRYAGPCHCSGDKARSLFEKRFGKNYIRIGVGKVITLADLQ
jgi:7,8-dihydropterin-6-yl-methyl-4-(beta-D-ribofuranosyl)aminobenzene 5'-phosphate synthase